MRFFILKEFRGGNVEEYLRNAFTSVLRNLQAGLSQLDFADNFASFVAEDVIIPAGGELAIRNFLDATEVPRWRVILNQVGGGVITDGPTAWDSDFVYLSNAGGADATVSVAFFR
jgi:hypothetical protein